MGLAAVPFGMAQAEDYEVRVRREEKPDAMHFKISVSGFVQPFEGHMIKIIRDRYVIRMVFFGSMMMKPKKGSEKSRFYAFC